jgi:hypothetical protein
MTFFDGILDKQVGLFGTWWNSEKYEYNSYFDELTLD